jgi:uncharacterized membrane protein
MVHLSPTWNGLHPLVVHFPIALLLIAPLFVVVGAALPSAKGRPFLVSGLILMALGTAAVFAATTTGEAAMESVGSTPAIRATLEEHRDLARTTQVLFSVITVVFAALLFVPKLLRRELGPRVNAAMLAAFLVLYATGVLFLVNTTLQGEGLVHDLGVKAPAAVGVGWKGGGSGNA